MILGFIIQIHTYFNFVFGFDVKMFKLWDSGFASDANPKECWFWLEIQFWFLNWLQIVLHLDLVFYPSFQALLVLVFGLVFLVSFDNYS